MEKTASRCKYVVSTEKSGDLHVYVQGDLSQQGKRAVFLTVHDLGCNHTSFHDFVNHPCMCEIKERSVFIHIDVPGHEDNAPNLTTPFPTLQVLGEDLVTVLDFLHVKYVIGLGEGAGANVLARFGLAYPQRALGLILINCTGSAASVMDTFKSKQLVNDSNPDKEKVMQEFQSRLRGTINNKNLKLYVNAFLGRKDLPLKTCKTDVLLITGLLSSYAHVVEKLHRDMDKTKATLLKIERAGDVLLQAPYKVAQSILLFCKGQGLLTSLTLPGVDRQRAFSGGSFDGEGGPRRLSRGMSMEEYDKPNIRRLSITISNDGVSNKHN
ncbi:Protein ZK1073.1 [Gryllus bimaculatus]|nr:Protein ZK1073.1 [Gryllus bimaculatus]